MLLYLILYYLIRLYFIQWNLILLFSPQPYCI
nr:MAG TPA: hypothetical protein [Caudoviricetes sp.]